MGTLQSECSPGDTSYTPPHPPEHDIHVLSFLLPRFPLPEGIAMQGVIIRYGNVKLRNDDSKCLAKCFGSVSMNYFLHPKHFLNSLKESMEALTGIIVKCSRNRGNC